MRRADLGLEWAEETGVPENMQFRFDLQLCLDPCFDDLLTTGARVTLVT